MTEPAYDSYTTFYQEVYGHAVREVRPAGRTGAAMLQASQGAGDWSDAPVPDLVLAMSMKTHAACTIDVGGGRFFAHSAQAGDFALVPPHTATTFIVESDHELRALALPYAALLELAGPGEALPPQGDFGVLHTRLNQSAEVTRLMARLWDEGLHRSPRGALYADGLLLQLAAELVGLAGHPAAPVPRGGLAPWQARRVTEFLQDHLAQDVSLAELAALVGLSTAHFCRAFKQSTGLPPHQWRLARRVERARELLERTGLPVTDIAAAVGYEDPGQFAVAFRRITGATPSQYRKDRRA